MSTDTSGYVQAKETFGHILSLRSGQPDTGRPLATLTFAQSLDGKIARPSEQLLLSGRRSMEMTHCLRTMHDAIMVGIGTVLCDNPRLSARLVPQSEAATIVQPQPIVLDSHLRFPTDANLLTGPKENGRLRMPWIIAGPDHDRAKREKLEILGARVIVVERCDASGHPVLGDVLDRLWQLGVKRLMVEGGAHVIQSFLSSRLTDLLIVTIAPMLVGDSGVPAVPSARGIPSLSIEPLAYEQFGADIVMIAKTKTVAR
ncbi:bacterial bifunctional deaminase-reductase [Martensiomyces pterosporus]|nr:bacterial bifunctional deaminase-reductase [Martensiomyces pterosporus]